MGSRLPYSPPALSLIEGSPFSKQAVGQLFQFSQRQNRSTSRNRQVRSSEQRKVPPSCCSVPSRAEDTSPGRVVPKRSSPERRMYRTDAATPMRLERDLYGD